MKRNKVALILGVGTGIGKAIVYSFAKNAYLLYFSSRDKQKSEILLRNVKKINKKVHYICSDCSKEEDVINLKNAILRNEKRIDVLVINTGKWISKSLEKHTDEDYENLMNSNLRAHFLIYKYFGEQFKKQKCGLIFTVVGIFGTSFLPKNQSVYNATKAACYALSKSFAQELSDFGVRLFIINPGETSHNMFSKNLDKDLATNPELIRLGLPEDVALLIEKISSFPQIFSTGSVFEVAGDKSSTIY